MTFTQEILEDIMTDAQLGFSLREIAVRLGVDTSVMLHAYHDETTQVKRYYDGGVSLGKLETDKALYGLAKSGSSSAKAAYDEKLKAAKFSNEINQIFNEY